MSVRPDLVAFEYAGLTNAQQVGYWPGLTGDEIAVIYRQSAATYSGSASITGAGTIAGAGERPGDPERFGGVPHRITFVDDVIARIDDEEEVLLLCLR